MRAAIAIISLAIVAAVSASATVRIDPAPAGYGSDVVVKRIPIVRFTQDIRTDSDAVAFETGHGILYEDSTQVVSGRGGSYDDGYGKIVKTDSALVKTGTYSYTSPEGTPIVVRWVADENGFRAEGDHIPKAPVALH